MIFLVIWSTQTNRIYVSQNSGVVQAANKTYIMSSYSGSITELYVSEGSYVNEGDLIARLKSTDLDMQKDNLQPAGYLPEAAGSVQQAAQMHSGRHQLFRRDECRGPALLLPVPDLQKAR